MNTTLPVTIRAEWDEDAQVWYIADSTYPGLVLESPSLDLLIKNAREALAELRELNGEHSADPDMEMVVHQKAA
ncbi:DUF1902 domain-containing protein [Rhodovarius lipocyclicus]|uniref:DUF1902 domain-containing protein n=1 Tax=Rhodovarius lipocyclicus TaxID=268410 RepID=UPI001359FD3B|nr:DUF1902 domain-containing protein [Rhodovarius lipocyclicus]